MLSGALEILAYCSLGVAMGLLLVRLFWPRLAPRVEVRRFRHRLGTAERVLATWVAECTAQDEARRLAQRHPERTDD